MIEFKGNLSKQCKNYLTQYSRRLTFLVILAVCIPFAIVSVFLAIVNDWIYLLFMIPIVILLFFGSLKPETKLYRLCFGKNGGIYDGELQWHIMIEQNDISAEGIQRIEKKDLKNIKKVVDMGDWYKIYFYFPHKSNIFLCQKDLLVEGTLEEFENLFEDKLIRKINQ